MLNKDPMTQETLRHSWTEIGDRVRGFVRRRVNDPHAADDIAQDVLLKVQEHVGTLAAEDKLPAWIVSVGRNAIVDYYRARAVRDHAHVADVDPIAASADADGDAAAARELSPCVMRMVEQLPEPYREALKLADFEGLGQQEIADRAGLSLSGAKSRIQRARQQLREMLLDCCHVERDRRGNVIDYQTTDRSARYCGGSEGRPQCGT
jgi:RNA polymerase sigma-70 factor (ECF subfamily)